MKKESPKNGLQIPKIPLVFRHFGLEVETFILQYSVSPLDDPIWHALNSHHNHLAIWGEDAVRYQPDILGAASPENSSVGFTNLRGLVETDEIVGVMGSLPEDLSGWEVLYIDQV